LFQQLLEEAPFRKLRDRVLWLDRRDRRVWGELIFAAAAPRLRPVEHARGTAAD
jgi:hypothetical protein